MNEREYFEQLVSAELDGAITPQEKAELDEQLKRDSDLRAFRHDLLRQSEMLRSLPKLVDERLRRQPIPENAGKGILARIWRMRISLPAPVASAAAILLFVAGLLIAHSPSTNHQSTAEFSGRTNVVLYESDRLEPSTSHPVVDKDSKLN